MSKTSSELSTLSCPSCRVQLRIKTAYAHLKGRCPECGFRIKPIREKPFVPLPLTSTDQAMDLVPIEEEWPEPAEVVQRPSEEGVAYGVSTQQRSLPTRLDDGRTVAPIEEADPYAVHQSLAAAPGVFAPPLSDAETNPLRAADPPRPLGLDIYLFPLHVESLRPLFYMSFLLSLMALTPAALHAAHEMLGEKAMLGNLLIVVFNVGLLALAGTYSAAAFLAVIEDTAAGNPIPRITIVSGLEGLWRMFYIGWILMVSAVPAWIFRNLLISPEAELTVWLPIVVIPPLVLFPILLLCSLAAGSPWSIVDATLLMGMKRHPLVLLYILAHSTLLCAACLGTAYVLVHWPDRIWMVPVTGIVWAACTLIYARMLGRAGWALTHGAITVQPIKKPRRPKPIPTDEDVF